MSRAQCRVPKGPLASARGKPLLSAEKWKWFPASYFLLAIWNPKEKWKWFLPCRRAMEMPPKCPRWSYLVFLELFGSCVHLVAPEHSPWAGTSLQRVASSEVSSPEEGDLPRPHSAVACPHLWSSFWMEFCAYWSPSPALTGCRVPLSVSVQLPLDLWVQHLLLDGSLCPKPPQSSETGLRVNGSRFHSFL